VQWRRLQHFDDNRGWDPAVGEELSRDGDWSHVGTNQDHPSRLRCRGIQMLDPVQRVSPVHLARREPLQPQKLDVT